MDYRIIGQLELRYKYQMQIRSEAELEVQVTLRCLECLLNLESGEEKSRLQAVIRGFEGTRSKRELSVLAASQQQLFALLVDGFTAYRDGFYQAISEEKYQNIRESNFDIIGFLLGIQKNLKIDKQNPTSDMLVSKYTVGMIALKKKYDVWEKDFFLFWTSKAIERLKKLENKRLQTPQDLLIQILKQDELLLRQDERLMNKTSEGKSRAQEARETESKKKERKSARDRTAFMEKYLEERKDLSFDKVKHRQITEFLEQKLQYFMKQAIQKLIDISATKNKKNPRFGNEIDYFAPQNERVSHEDAIYASSNTQIFALSYKHKLEIYTTLRSKQIEKQDQLRNAFEQSMKQSKKRADKKIQEYMLRPRPKELKNTEIFKPESSKDSPEPRSYMISTEHVIFFLQNHHYLRNSLVLFNSFHY